MTAVNSGTDRSVLEKELTTFLAARTGEEPAVDQDLFGTGVISSMFALELVVHLEDEYDIEIVGSDLSRDNFSSVRAMSDMVLRLRPAGAGGQDT